MKMFNRDQNNLTNQLMSNKINLYQKTKKLKKHKKMILYINTQQKT